MGHVGCPETLINKFETTLHNIPIKYGENPILYFMMNGEYIIVNIFNP